MSDPILNKLAPRPWLAYSFLICRGFARAILALCWLVLIQLQAGPTRSWIRPFIWSVWILGSSAVLWRLSRAFSARGGVRAGPPTKVTPSGILVGELVACGVTGLVLVLLAVNGIA